MHRRPLEGAIRTGGGESERCAAIHLLRQDLQTAECFTLEDVCPMLIHMQAGLYIHTHAMIEVNLDRIHMSSSYYRMLGADGSLYAMFGQWKRTVQWGEHRPASETPLSELPQQSAPTRCSGCVITVKSGTASCKLGSVACQDKVRGSLARPCDVRPAMLPHEPVSYTRLTLPTILLV